MTETELIPTQSFYLSRISEPAIDIVAGTKRFKWEVRYEYRPPDCIKKLVITINGRSPGPTIVAEQNDTIIIEPKNGWVTENVAVHWHRNSTDWNSLPGTYMYHAHYGMQMEAGLYGSIQVRLPKGQAEPFFYDYDQSIILNDWLRISSLAALSALSFQDLRNATTPPGIAILNYQPNRRRAAPSTVAPPGPLWSDIAPRLNQGIAIKARQGFVNPPTPTADKTIVLLNTQNLVDGYYRWSINNVSLDLPHTPYLIALKENNISNAFDHPPPERI
ncbi:hypothetical protein Patl1_27327 [Pistacia atlantica]|uniref:Uncharacterized protein n=1 Tax=Pistacia atlantica TaxID=434234 RepID=A0ACC1BDY2_9ROSI|nr:hypothetical protein Patl1_27327 [Pistacia atlantica]